ncbi:hypothetical protein ACLIBG_05035 [Virgibacillus sp. W0181]|uniref:hypothetical protein n=1 Tax=Virgibacillus sp. W0181 TaxID=3391581 RepID=UPI003F4778C9
MLLTMRQIVLTIHILLGIAWFGGILFVGWGVYPVVKKMAILEQQYFLTALMKGTHKLFALAGAGVILTGISLGTIFGPIKQWEVLFNSTYGSLFLLAIIIGTLSLLWGVFVGHKQTMKMLLNDPIWNYAAKGETKPLNQAMRNITILTSVEVMGLTTLIIIMVLL